MEIESITIERSHPKDGILIRKDQTTLKIEIKAWDGNEWTYCHESLTFPSGDEVKPLATLLTALAKKIDPPTDPKKPTPTKL